MPAQTLQLITLPSHRPVHPFCADASTADGRVPICAAGRRARHELASRASLPGCS